jgi:hypothetical protein
MLLPRCVEWFAMPLNILMERLAMPINILFESLAMLH